MTNINMTNYSGYTLTSTQKSALQELMNDYFDANATTTTGSVFKYDGSIYRENYATKGNYVDGNGSSGPYEPNTDRYYLNCGLFAQMIWMGRKITDFTNYQSGTPTLNINKKFSWGYYFDFLPAQLAYKLTNSSGAYYDSNSYENASGTTVATKFDNAASMAAELHRIGCEIPYGEADIGDLIFYRTDSMVDGNTDQLEQTYFRNISHVVIVYDKDTNGNLVLMECTNTYARSLGKCGLLTSGSQTLESGRTLTISDLGRARAANLDCRVVMCARHPAANPTFTGNVPSAFTSYRYVAN